MVDTHLPLSPREHEKRIEQTACWICGSIAFLVGVALVVAIWSASVRWPELFE